MEPYQNRTDRPRVYTGTDGIVPYTTASGTRTGLGPARNRTKKFSCKHPEPFSLGTHRNDARGNSTEDS